jgi:6-phospho-beta-glucosidase
MNRKLTISIVGAGSSYTPELVEGILARATGPLPVGEVRMTDIDSERLSTMANLATRMVRRSGQEIAIKSSLDLPPMIDGVDFVITQIRTGGMHARYLDESIPLKYGMIGQETTGPGGMFKALRTIPRMIEIAHAVERYAPAAFILNYTNPSGVITEAVSKYSKARIIGLCAGIPAIQAKLKQRLKPLYPDLKTYCVGLNHLSFVHRMISEGRDVTREAIDYLAAQDTRDSIDNADMAEMKIAKLIGAIPIAYTQYFFFRGDKLAQAMQAAETRAQQVMKIEKEVLAEAARPETDGKPEALKRRGGEGYAEITFACMTAIVHNSGEELVANVPSRGCVDGIEPDAVAELVCRIDCNGAAPLPVGPIPLAVRGIVQAIKAYESLTVEAAVKRDGRLAIQALLNHPLAGDLRICEPLVDEMLRAHELDFGHPTE